MIKLSRSTGLISVSGLIICALLITSVLSVSAASDERLGTAEDFSVLAGQSVTNTGPSVIELNLGVSPGTSITGFPPGLVSGEQHSADAVALQAQTDTTTAYNTLAGAPCPNDLTDQDLGNQEALVPGVYCFSSSAQLTGSLVLDAQGEEDALFIFQVGSTLTTASDSSVSFINGTSCNVYWQVGSSATLGTNTDFIGNIVALTSITMDTGADLEGRALARNGSVTLDSNDISNLDCAIPPTATPADPTATPVTPTATPVTPTATPVTPTATSVPATAIPGRPGAQVPGSGIPGGGGGGPVPDATPTSTPVAPAAQTPVQTAVAPRSGSEQPASPTAPDAGEQGQATAVPTSTQPSGGVIQTPTATVETEVTYEAVATFEAVATVAPAEAFATQTPVTNVSFPNTGSQSPSEAGMTTTNLLLAVTVILFATGALVVTVDRRSRS